MFKRKLPFTIAEYEYRADQVRRRMAERGLDVLILVSEVSSNYLIGSLGGVQFLTVPLNGDLMAFSWELERPVVLYSSRCDDCAVWRTREDSIQAFRRALDERDLLKGTVGIERNTRYLSVDDHEHLMNELKGAKVASGSEIMGDLVRIKSPAEIALIKKAGQITAKGMNSSIEATRVGVMDYEVAAAAYQAMIAAGSLQLVGQPYVTVGPRSGIAHTRHHGYRIEDGDPVWLEMSASCEYYSCPSMRTVFVGTPPAGAKALADASMESLERVLAVMRPGIPASTVADAGAAVLPLADPEIGSHHTYGYSIGLGFPPSWADTPDYKIKKGDKTILQPGMVFHVTMGLRRNFQYGAVCSEVVAVTQDGCEVLSTVPRQYYYK